QCCNEIDDSSEVYKINKLELDLGFVDKNNLIEDFRSKVLKQFYEGLSQAIRNMPSKEEVNLRDQLATESGAYPGGTDEDTAFHYKSDSKESELELLSHFMKTGRLPWWSRNAELIDLIAVMDNQLKAVESQFIKLLEEAIAYPAVIKRLIYQFSNNQLQRIVEILAEINREAIGEIFNNVFKCLIKLPRFEDDQEKIIQNNIWQSIFAGLVTDLKGISEKEEFEELLIKHLPEQYRVELVKPKKAAEEEIMEKESVLAITIANKESQLSMLFKEISALVKENEDKKIFLRPDIKVLESAGESLFELLDNIKSIKEQQISQNKAIKVGELTTMQLKHRLISLTTIFQEKLLQLGNRIQSILNAELVSTELIKDRNTREKLETIQALVNELVNSIVSRPGKKRFVFDFSVKTGDDVILTTKEPTPNDDEDDGHQRVKHRRKKHSDLFAESEEIYINNSGLVLLWPYLGRFFKSVGCMDGNQFIDKAKQEHTVLLLQYLIQGHQGFNEYDLALNKILCGLDPNYPVPTVVELEDKEIEEADTLMSTLIQHWTVLKNMSPDGFRRMFLNREGMISTRDGNYVLRVEEQAYDVLIDKMPWQITTIKLPWMENLIFVEWRL
ncbi:MAG: hypothetical protein MJE63_27900, partial [Proteobacteria bacterium]|nr:hypothetical protein [Pseudomonadota bacterium]